MIIILHEINLIYIDLLFGKRRKRQQKMRWLDSISNTMEMNLNKLQEIVKDREGWYVAAHGVAKSGTQLSNWTTKTTIIPWISLEHFCLNWNVHQHVFLTCSGYPLSVLLLQYLLQLFPSSFIVLYAAFLTINVIMAIIDTHHLVLSFFFLCSIFALPNKVEILWH